VYLKIATGLEKEILNGCKNGQTNAKYIKCGKRSELTPIVCLFIGIRS